MAVFKKFAFQKHAKQRDSKTKNRRLDGNMLPSDGSTLKTQKKFELGRRKIFLSSPFFYHRHGDRVIVQRSEFGPKGSFFFSNVG
jgi:hypothetical protein